MSDSMTNAARDVLAERARHLAEEGWTPEHDDAHDMGELARAAACYANLAGNCFAWTPNNYQTASPPHQDEDQGIISWPWDIEWWKPKNPRADLVRAGSLILAEIERLDRRGVAL